MPKGIICADSFKGTFKASDATSAIALGVRQTGCEAVELPLADGGEGTLDALSRGAAERRSTVVAGPLGDPVDAEYGLLDGGRVGVIEMAQASGLELVPPERRDAWAASTRGTGQLIAAVAAAGVQRILVSVGGSATTDGGAGALAALASAGIPLPPLTVLCDVDTPFEHAATVFGPQKGADPDTVERLTARLHEFATGLPRDPRGLPMTGCAGGLSGGLWAAYGAELVSGANHVLDFVGFDRILPGTDFVITGEGRLDAQSLAGKVVSAVAEGCRAHRVPCFAAVGQSALDLDTQARAGFTQVIEASTLASLSDAGSHIAKIFTMRS